MNSVASYAYGTINHWPFSFHAEAAAVYATLANVPANSYISLYTDSQATISDISSYASRSYSDVRTYYKITNFELWSSIHHLIQTKNLRVSPYKIKAHAGNY